MTPKELVQEAEAALVGTTFEGRVQVESYREARGLQFIEPPWSARRANYCSVRVVPVPGRPRLTGGYDQYVIHWELRGHVPSTRSSYYPQEEALRGSAPRALYAEEAAQGVVNALQECTRARRLHGEAVAFQETGALPSAERQEQRQERREALEERRQRKPRRRWAP